MPVNKKKNTRKIIKICSKKCSVNTALSKMQSAADIKKTT